MLFLSLASSATTQAAEKKNAENLLILKNIVDVRSHSIGSVNQSFGQERHISQAGTSGRNEKGTLIVPVE